MDLFNRRNKPRQEWEPHWTLKLLHALWSAAIGIVKIAAGAVATVALICVVCAFVFVGILGGYLQGDILPNADYDLENAVLDQTSFVYYVDGDSNIQLLQQIHTSADRQMASSDEIPEDLKNAAIAIEDKRFYEHQGVDWITTVKACANMFFGGNETFGGSTITQQLLKNITDEDSVTVQRKVMEIFRALQVEKQYDKETLLTLYLNTIYMGRGCYGVKSAAAEYFGKELQMLTTAECASLISITNNPSIFNPFGSTFEWDPGDEEGRREMTAPERNRVRQVNTLWVMKEEGLISQEEYDEALAQEMVFRSGIQPEDRWTVCESERCAYEGIASTYGVEGEFYVCPVCGHKTSVTSDSSQEVYSYFVDTVIEDVASDLAAQNGVDFDSLDKSGKMYWKEVIQRGGYHIYSTLDKDVQNAIDKIYTDPDNIARTRHKAQLQSGMVVIDNRSGDIVGMAGGVGEKTVHDGLNRATDSKLQTGSSQKPLSVYAPAFEAGEITPATVVPDLPVSYRPVFPKNDNRRYNFSRTVFSGVTASVNAIAVRTLRMVGYDYAYEFAKEKFGLSHLTDFYETSSGKVLNDLGDSPLGMGALTVGATVREMANAYATFANNGVFREARTYTKVYDSEGNLVLDNVQESREILSEKTVNYMNYCLSNAVSGGTGGEARISGHEVCGKTGTTSSNKDRWFCGYTGYYTAAVWCGFDQPAVIRITSGENNPSAVLFRKVLKPLHEGKKKISLWSTSGMRSYSVCLDSGRAATEACGKDLRAFELGLKRTSSAYAYSGDGPKGSCDQHVVVDYCVTGGGVATEYCSMFAREADMEVEIGKRALLKLTEDDISTLKKANGAGLADAFVYDNYVYYVSDGGEPRSWHGFSGKANKDVDAPYVVCPKHNEKTWQEYQDSLVTEPPTEPPTEPSATEAPVTQETTPPAA